MFERVRRPGHATVVAYLALFVAIGGTAVAAKKIQSNEIAKNAVKTKKIADGAVTNPKIADFAVNGQKLADEAVTEAKLAQDSVSGNKIQQAVIGTGKLRDAAVENSKIADGAVTGAKVLDGSLGLADTAAVLTNGTLDPGNIVDGTCAPSDIPVFGAQAGDRVSVMPRIDASNDNRLFPVAGQAASGTVAVWLCNFSGAGTINAQDQAITIALYR
jgi:hypothetical protein